jgi:hypothetical protein
VSGSAKVRFEPAAAHTTGGAATISPRDRALDWEIVKQPQQTCDFEVVVSWIIGVKSPSHYRVLPLDEPCGSSSM